MDDLSVHTTDAPEPVNSHKAKPRRAKRKRSAGVSATTPGNQDEALQMRARLGISSADAASASTCLPFAFGFAPPHTAAGSASEPGADVPDLDVTGSGAQGQLHQAGTSAGGAGAAPDRLRAPPGDPPAGATAVGAEQRHKAKKHTAAAVEAQGSGSHERRPHLPAAAAEMADGRSVPGTPADQPKAAQAHAPDIEAEATASGNSIPHGAAEAKASTATPGACCPDGTVPRRVYVGGMPFWYDEAAVRDCWHECGGIEDVAMLTFPDTGKFRGIVFITFDSDEAYQAALEYDGDHLDGMTLVVKPCKAHASVGRVEQQAKAPKAAGQPTHRARQQVVGEATHGGRPPGPTRGGGHAPGRVEGYDVAYVGNIAWEVDKAAVEALFSSLQPKFVRMFNDSRTGKHRGFAHVHFADAAAVDRAVGLDGQLLRGRKLKVMYAQPSRKHEQPAQRLQQQKSARQERKRARPQLQDQE